MEAGIGMLRGGAVRSLAIVETAPAFRSMRETLNPKASIPDRKGIIRKSVHA
jgi:hypothetical protein